MAGGSRTPEAAGPAKIRVMIVDDIAETRDNLEKLLFFEKDIEVVAKATTGREALALAKQHRPDVVLMDINMPDMDGITATELIRRSSPATQIVILSVQGDPNYMRRAMLAGARDFLTKPPAVDELTAAVRRAGKMAQDERAKAAAIPQGLAGGAGGTQALQAGKIIVVYSPKGGNGVTMTAVNLAITLHNPESPVVLVDGNLQFGDLAVFLNEQVRNSVLDLALRADELDPEIVEEVLINHAASGVKLLAAPQHPEYAEKINGEQFGKVLKYLTRMFSYVVVDSSSILTDVVLGALDLADVIILLTTQDIPSIKNARLFLDLADVMGIDRQKILFAMNRFDKRIGILPEKIGESFKHEVIAVIPFDERIVLTSINKGIPFMLGDRTIPLARVFLNLVSIIKQRIADRLAAEEPAPVKR